MFYNVKYKYIYSLKKERWKLWIIVTCSKVQKNLLCTIYLFKDVLSDQIASSGHLDGQSTEKNNRTPQRASKMVTLTYANTC